MGMHPTVYDRLRIRPVINCKGIYTDLGGGTLSPTVWAAMGEANLDTAEMVPLLESSGRRVAELVGAEAGWIIPGASAAIALATAACMTGGDGAAIERLPDTRGLRSEVVIQRAQRYKYLRMVWMTGARLVEVGSDAGTTRGELEAALDPATVAAAFVPAHLDGLPGIVPLREIAAMARARGIPTIVDAAYLNYPPASMRRFAQGGADIVCFSAKYWYGPNGGGVVAGRRDLIEAVAQVDFTRFESGRWLRFGRPFKLDRHTVVGTVVALEEWFAMDHEARWAGYVRVVRSLANAVAGLPGVEVRPLFLTMQETLEPAPINCLRVRLDRSVADRTVADVHRALWEGDPRIVAHLDRDALILAVDAMPESSSGLVAERLRKALTD